MKNLSTQQTIDTIREHHEDNDFAGWTIKEIKDYVFNFCNCSGYVATQASYILSHN
jgi:hypothetical protein